MTDRRQFKCALCGEMFYEEWTDAEAEAELAETFPGFDKSECETLCDDCFNRVMNHAPVLGPNGCIICEERRRLRGEA